MKKWLAFVAFLAIYCNSLFCQDDCAIFLKINQFYCRGDYEQAASLIQKQIDAWPDNRFQDYLFTDLGNVFLKAGKLDLAGKAFRNALRQKQALLYKATSHYCPHGVDSSRCQLFNHDYFVDGKIGACYGLSDLCIQKKDFRQAIHWLYQADTSIFSYRGCGEGVLASKCDISVKMANLYLMSGDTSAAINRLIDFGFNPGCRRVFFKLKKILHHKFTIEQLKSETQKGLNSVRLVPSWRRDNPDCKDAEMIFLGHKFSSAFTWFGNHTSSVESAKTQLKFFMDKFFVEEEPYRD